MPNIRKGTWRRNEPIQAGKKKVEVIDSKLYFQKLVPALASKQPDEVYLKGMSPS